MIQKFLKRARNEAATKQRRRRIMKYENDNKNHLLRLEQKENKSLYIFYY